eukprot:CCRYP_000362-RA/>CCRYP_000362-RA protein AED:0.72 eAED:1.00 QI:0/0/0/1/0/0/2/0/118
MEDWSQFVLVSQIFVRSVFLNPLYFIQQPRQPFQPFQSSPSSSSHPPHELFDDLPDDPEDVELLELELELELELPQSSSQEVFHPRRLAKAFSTRIKTSNKETIGEETSFISARCTLI